MAIDVEDADLSLAAHCADLIMHSPWVIDTITRRHWKYFLQSKGYVLTYWRRYKKENARHERQSSKLVLYAEHLNISTTTQNQGLDLCHLCWSYLLQVSAGVEGYGYHARFTRKPGRYIITIIKL